MSEYEMYRQMMEDEREREMRSSLHDDMEEERYMNRGYENRDGGSMSGSGRSSGGYGGYSNREYEEEYDRRGGRGRGRGRSRDGRGRYNREYEEEEDRYEMYDNREMSGYENRGMENRFRRDGFRDQRFNYPRRRRNR